VSARWLVLCGVVVAGLAVALMVMVHRDERPVTPTIDAAVVIEHARDAAMAIAVIVDASSPDAAPSAALATLRASGSGRESWDGQATSLLEAVAAGALSSTTPECYIAGCAATFTFANDAVYRERTAAMTASDTYRAWTGGKVLTEPDRKPDGRVVVTLLLYRPD
jgi:hypothetical protein